MYVTYDQLRTDQARAQQVYLILVGYAHERKLTTYKLLAKTLGFEGAGVFSGILGHIMFWCEENGLPHLTALVVRSDTGLPGDGLTEAKNLDAERERVFNWNWFAIVPPSQEELDAVYEARSK